jgi:hypothetical protein
MHPKHPYLYNATPNEELIRKNKAFRAFYKYVCEINAQMRGET